MDLFANCFLNNFVKITPVNGFDIANPDNAMQNNYAWSMAEMGEYIYVGTARNIPYSIITSGLFGEIPVPEILAPKNVDMSGEIWRYKKDGSPGWERVYKAPPEPVNIGFRFMVTYTTPQGETALYAGALTPLSPDLLIIKSTDGVNWYPLDSGITGFSTRYMIEHQGMLYMGALPLLGLGSTQLYRSSDPERNGWELIDVSGDPERNPQGNVDLLLSFNNHLYVGTALPTGFELWRTLGAVPEKDNWKLVVDKGAGDARNEHPWALAVFKDYIYIGTAIEAAVRSVNPDQPVVPPKGFDVIRVDCNDRWELIVGGFPVVPTMPKTGVRGLPLSGYPSGFGNISNAYCWQIQAQGDELYLGTFSWSVLIPPFIPLFPEIIKNLISNPSPLENKLENKMNIKGYTEALENYMKYLAQANPFFDLTPIKQALEIAASYIMILGQKVFGFDLWKTRDGINWIPVTLNGLGNPYNYGVRMLFLSENGNLYLGTANPFQGAEVWVKPGSNNPYMPTF